MGQMAYIWMDVGSADHLARHELHIPKLIVQHLPTSLTPVFLIKIVAIPAALALSWAPCPNGPNGPPTSPSHCVLSNMRGDEEVNCSTPQAGQLHQCNIQKCHSQSI
eukprot:780871-Pelagomonas_calceolata.AAC.2